MSIIFILVILGFCSENQAQNLTNKALHPIILVPGDGGSQMEARLNKTTKPGYFCQTVTDWYTLWLDAQQLIPLTSSCWADNIKLLYNSTSRTTYNNIGIETRIPGFGNSSTVEYLNTYKSSYALYFNSIADSLVQIGYERGKNLHGAPYDFRKAANELGEYFDNVTKLIEDTYEANGQQKVILLCHSMGSPMMLHLLQSKTQAWKDKYIRAMVTLAGVWGGTVRALKVYLLGDNLGSYFVDSSNIGIQERTNPSLAWLMPKDVLWGPDDVFLESKEVNITTKNIQEVYKALNHSDGEMMWEDTKDLLQNLTAPNVEVFCLHGTDVPSVEKLVYKSFPTSSPTLVTGDGDGTVNIRSLEACLQWRNHQTQQVHHHTFPKIDHGSILQNPSAVEYVKRLIMNITEDIKPESLDKTVHLKMPFGLGRSQTYGMPSPLNVEDFSNHDDYDDYKDQNDIFNHDPNIEIIL